MEAGPDINRDIAERLGEHGARIKNLEDRDRAIDDQFREVRAALNRIEAAGRSNGGPNTSDQLMHRVLDVLAKPHAPTPDIGQAIAEAMRAKRTTDPFAVFGYLLGGTTLGGGLTWVLMALNALN